ncbi:MAG: M14 family zinc carboxypeptidase [Candidatus Hodarchaeota archaeon]
MHKKTLMVAYFPLLFFLIGNAQIQAAIIIPFNTLHSFETSSIIRDWSNLSLLYSDQYHCPNELFDELKQVNDTASEIADLFSIGKSIQGREIYCVRITNEQNTQVKPKALFLGEHHAREQITTEMTIRFLLRLVNNYGIDQKITEYVNNQEIYIIPALNPDGLQYGVGNDSLAGNEWLRKNLRAFDDDNDGLFDEDPIEDTNGDGLISEFDVFSWNDMENDWIFQYYYLEGIDNDNDGLINEDRIGGIDLNRNYAYRWNDSTTDSGWGNDRTLEDYPGTSPFSEPETAAYRDFVTDKRFAAAISFHSGINATYFPWSSAYYWPEEQLYYNIYEDLKEILPPGYLSVEYGTQIENTNIYTTAGDWGDWMYAAKACLVPLTFEIYHNASSDDLYTVIDENETHRILRWDGMYGYFAPKEGPAIDDLWEDIKPVFDYWLELTPRLNVTVTSVTGDKNINENLNVKLSIKNLSPRIGTIEDLLVIYADNTSVLYDGKACTIPEVAAGITAKSSFYFTLEEEITKNSSITLKIGNPYAGYKTIVIQEEQIKAKSIPLGFIAQYIAIPIFIYMKKRENS